MSKETTIHLRRRRGAGRSTLHDVAALAGVSAISVSRYFKQAALVSPALRERIAAAVAQLGYVPNLVAGGLASAQNRIVGMVVPNLSGPIFAATIQTFSDVLAEHSYQSMLASSYFSLAQEESAVRAFLGWSPAALVLTSRHHSEGTEQLIANTGIPVIEVWDYAPERVPIQIGFRHDTVGEMAATYLLERGYQRIAFVQNALAGDLSALDRRDGYAEVIKAAGRTPIFYSPTRSSPFDAGEEALIALTQVADPADAIIMANDNLAIGAILAAQRLGIAVPSQCAIMGFGDYPLAEKLQPSLTTIRPPSGEMGALAAQHALALLGALDTDASVSRLNQLPCSLIMRESA